MTIHKLDFDDFNEIDYQLIAIHTPLEDYRLAYLINQELSINLSKQANDILINIKEGESKFSRFCYSDAKNTVVWNLVQNKSEVVQNKRDNLQNLFSTIDVEVATKVYLLSEFKKVDYFLKIENSDEDFNLELVQSMLHDITKIATAYTVDTNKIKAKNNLIF